jgi:hypothetical protein
LLTSHYPLRRITDNYDLFVNTLLDWTEPMVAELPLLDLLHIMKNFCLDVGMEAIHHCIRFQLKDCKWKGGKPVALGLMEIILTASYPRVICQVLDTFRHIYIHQNSFASMTKLFKRFLNSFYLFPYHFGKKGKHLVLIANYERMVAHASCCCS